MSKVKQLSERWLSGLLAFIMLVGLVPMSGFITPAKAANAPDTITLNRITKETPEYLDSNLPSTNPSHNGRTRARVLMMNVDGYTGASGALPGFCGDHSLSLYPTTVWSGGESILTAEGGKYAPCYELLRWFVTQYLFYDWINENCPWTDGNPAADTYWRNVYTEEEYASYLGEGIYDLATARRRWVADLGYDPYLYVGEWEQQISFMIPQAACWMANVGTFTDATNEAQLAKIAESYLRAHESMVGPMEGNQITPESVADRVAKIKKYIAGTDSFSTGLSEWRDKIVDFYIYYPNRTGDQPIIVPLVNDSGIPNEAWMKVQKVDQNGNPVANAIFAVYNNESCTGRPAATITTDASGYGAITVAWDSALTERTFWVKETTVPDGYRGSSGVYSVTVSSVTNGTEETAKLIRNGNWVNQTRPDPNSESSLIQKVDEYGNGIGPGTFHFSCLEQGMEFDVSFNGNGLLTKNLQWADPSAPNYIPEGTYLVTETTGPIGYVVDPTPQEIRLWTEMLDDVLVERNSGPLTFVNYEKPRIMLEKRDEAGAGVEGAKFDVYHDGAFLTSIETGPDGTFTLLGDDGGGLPDGHYKLVETKAPAGYLLPTHSAALECDLNAEAGGNKLIVLSATNYHYPDIEIWKTQTGTMRGLKGAVFEVAIDGTSIGTYGPTDGTGRITIDYTRYGEFLDQDKDSWTISVREVVAPDGYMIDDPSWQSLTMRKGETLKTFRFEDEAPATIIIKKLDANTGNMLPGATFEVKVMGENIGIYPTNNKGILTIPYDRYARFLKDETRDEWIIEVREVTAPDGYLINDTAWHSEVLHRGETEKVFVFEDTKYPEIVIAKKDAETGEYLPNATFDIKIDGTNFAEQMTTGADGLIHITYAQYGRFLTDIDEAGKGWTITITEVKAPNLYNKDKQDASDDYTQTQDLRFGQSLSAFVFEDTSYRKIKVGKIDAQTGWPLKGATFHLQSVKLDEGGSYDEYLTTDESGYVLFENVPNGTYTLSEYQAPVGYDPDVYWSDGAPAIRTIVVTSDDPVITEFLAKNDPLTGIRIRKVDSVTGQPIAGALFRIEPLAPLQGAAIEETTDSNGLIILQDMPAGSYLITELSVPSPYIVDNTPRTVSIDDQHDDYVFTFENNAEGILYILKRSAETDEPLAGAWFNVHLADGTVIADVGPTGPNGYVSLSGLKPGNYVVKEIKAPDGHVIDGESKSFEVKESDSGKVYVLIFDNHSKPELWLRKVDALTGVGLEGAIFRIEKGDGEIIKQNAITDSEGFIKVPNLEPGTYFAIETKAPSGYLLDETPHAIVLEYGKTEVVRIKNEQPGGISIRKVDANTGEPLAGAQFQLYSIDDTPLGQPKTSGNDGYVRWSDLEPGYYTVREVACPEGYVLDKNPVKLEVVDFKTTEYVWKNTQTTTITVVKRDSETLVPLSGATFGVYNLDGGLMDTLVTDLNGVATSKRLDLGWYKVVEIKAPIGYVLNTNEHVVEVKADTPVTIEVTNQPDKGIIIHKYDAVTKAPLPGAWFELQKLDGTIVLSEFATDASGTVTTTIVSPGQYYLVETKAPTGYLLSTEKILVTVIEGEATVVNVDNIPESVIEIFKTDSVTGNPLSGVEFEIADSTGKVLQYVTTDATGRAYSKAVDAGVYLVKEAKTIDGYTKDETQYRVTVVEGQNALLHVKNTPQTVINITKIGASSKAPIAGAVFELYETCGIEPCTKVGQYVTNEYGRAVTEPLAPGIYKLREIIAPAGYILDETVYEIAVKPGEYNSIVIENQEAASLTVRKLDQSGNPLAGAVFMLETASHGLIGTLETDANGEATFVGLKAGHYIVTETQAPNGYAISEPASRNVTISYGVDNYIDFINNANGGLVIILQDKHTNVYLAGGQFIVIRESDQTVVYDSSTDITGTIVIGNLTPGWYVIKQAYAPDGYTVVDVEIKVEILVGTQQTVYFKAETAGLAIEKVSSKDPYQTLEGARFKVVREADGIVIGEYVTDKSGLALVNSLAPGRYTITELVAPDGFIRLEQPKTVEVKGGTNTHVTFTNVPRTSITVNVVDQTTKVGVAGCIVEVWKQNGSLVNSYTSDLTGVIETQKLDNGFYVLKLVKVVDGYSAVITEVTVKVTDASEVTHTFELVSDGILKVMSTDSNSTAIAGMRFTLTTFAGKRIGTFTTGKNGIYTFASLTPGIYTVTEDKAPEGFSINEEAKVQQIEVKTGGVAVITFAHSQTFGLQIHTTCQQTGAAVAGVKYQVTQFSGEIIGIYTSDAVGIAFGQLTPGWYLVTAIEAPAGYILVDTAPRTIQVLGDKLTTMDFVVSQQSSLRVKVVDGTTGTPLYNVHLLLKNGTTNIQEYSTNNEGYITLNQTIVAGGYVLQMISAPSGYIIDTVPKSIDVLNAETTEIVWRLYQTAGQIQVVVTSADYNENLDLPAGTPLSGAVFEIIDDSTYAVVDQMVSDSSGIAASAGLPIGRYKVRMVTAPAYYALSTDFYPEVRLKVNNDVVRVETTVSSVYLDVCINQKTNTTVTAGTSMRIDILKADSVSESRLDSFFVHLKVPTDVARITTLEPGTWDADVWYSISYKTNMQDYRILAANLLSSTRYSFDLSTQSLGLAAGEYVTDVRFEFGTVPSSFQLLDKTMYSLYVLSTVPTGYRLLNDIEIGGLYKATTVGTNGNVNISGSANSLITGTSGQAVVTGMSGQWVTDISSWSATVISKSTNISTLPKTGY